MSYLINSIRRDFNSAIHTCAACCLLPATCGSHASPEPHSRRNFTDGSLEHSLYRTTPNLIYVSKVGQAAWEEFALLDATGLTPLDILEMKTLNDAQFLNREATMGTVPPRWPS